MLRYIAARDHHVMRRVHRWDAPGWVRAWMTMATRAGDGWLYWIAGPLILLFGGGERWRAIAAAALAGTAGSALFLLLKRITGRQRPCAIEPHRWATLLPPDRFSFPSGHTIFAFATVLPVGLFYPALLPLFLFVAVSIAASRVVLGMHFLSDVLAGAALGIGLGLLAFHWCA
jgi:undecaprenyl-diphosphatase